MASSKLAMAGSPDFRTKLGQFRYGGDSQTQSSDDGTPTTGTQDPDSFSSALPDSAVENSDQKKPYDSGAQQASTANGILREAVNRWKTPSDLPNACSSETLANDEEKSDDECNDDSDRDLFEAAADFSPMKTAEPPSKYLKRFEYSAVGNGESDDQEEQSDDQASRSEGSEYKPNSRESSSESPSEDDSDEDYEPEWLSKAKAQHNNGVSRKRRYGHSGPRYEPMAVGTRGRNGLMEDTFIGAKSSFEMLRKIRKLREERASRKAEHEKRGSVDKADRLKPTLLSEEDEPSETGVRNDLLTKRLSSTDSDDADSILSVDTTPKSPKASESPTSLEARFLQRRKRQVLLSDDENGLEDEDEVQSSNLSFKHEFSDHEEDSDDATSTSSAGTIRHLKKTVVYCSSDDSETEGNDTNVRPKERSPSVLREDEDSTARFSESEIETKAWRFFNTASEDEIVVIPKCSARAAKLIITLRPFTSYDDMIEKFSRTQGLAPQIYDHYLEMLQLQKELESILDNCERIAQKIRRAAKEITDSERAVVAQPSLLSTELELKPYQLVGLNWEILMFQRGLNAVLADEMGLGKTVQVIAFLAYLFENSVRGPHLVVVPSSTLDNWLAEIHRWCPSLSVLTYYGSIEDRRFIRHEVVDEKKSFDVVVSPYSIVANSSDDRAFLKRLNICYAIFDEGHMLKSCHTARYKNLMKVKAKHRMLLTGTPLQNNLMELISLINFVMPHLFKEHADSLSDILCLFQTKKNGAISQYEKKKIEQAKNIMRPFFLRRLKSEVLSQLPKKHESLKYCDLTAKQKKLYDATVSQCIAAVNRTSLVDGQSSVQNVRCWFMQLRKVANHPLLLRSLYSDQKLCRMARALLQEKCHQDKSFDLVLEDMQVMNDFELHKLSCQYKKLHRYKLRSDFLMDSGKLLVLDSLLPDIKSQGNKVLLFSQFTMVLDVLEEYLKIKKYNYLRLDGSTPVIDRQMLIDEFSHSPDCFVFLLSTRAGGLGINLTAANVIILHDIDYNPYNDRQAEDRCHRVGQTKEVTVIKLIAKDTIDETMLAAAKRKLLLEQQLSALAEDDSEDIESLLKQAINTS